MDITKELKALWHTVFHDSAPVIDEFFTAFPMDRLAVAEYCGGELAAAAYVLPFGELVLPDLSRCGCAHIYAVGVRPDMRGRGLGVEVTNKAYELAQRLGFPAVVLHPASDSLFDFYRQHCGFSTAFTACVSRTVVSHGGAAALSPVCAEEYREVRENGLSGILHIDVSPQVLSLFTKLGGRLYTFDGGCAAVEEDGETAYFRELISSPGICAPLSSMTGLACAVVSAPCASGGVPFGMLRGAALSGSGYMGIALE